MGVKTSLSLQELQQLFKEYNFHTIEATTNGVVDTTYKVYNAIQGYILKKYERDMEQKITQDIEILSTLHAHALDVPLFVEKKGDWYLYTMLEGTSPKHITTDTIRLLARFIATYHSLHTKLPCSGDFLQNYPIEKILLEIKQNYFTYYKKLQTLRDFKLKNEGFIHGDIFVDNTLVSAKSFGVIDFIDGNCGSFAFDAAVALLSFNPKNKPLFNNLFLHSYNRYAKQKLSHKELAQMRIKAAQLYALLRVNHFHTTKKAKILLFNHFL